MSKLVSGSTQAYNENIIEVTNLKKPRILLSGNEKLEYYIAAVEGLGGIADAKYLPPVSTDYDGLLLCGGNDVEPKHYGEDVNGAVKFDPARDEVELALIKAFLDAGKPIFGICRGLQLLNVYFGGTLHQDLENADFHTSHADFDIVHSAIAAEGSSFQAMYGKEFSINSFHHQGIKRLADGFKVTLTAPDGVIEAIEHETLPIFAVQFHPEKMCYLGSRPDTVDGGKIIEQFLEMCKE